MPKNTSEDPCIFQRCEESQLGNGLPVCLKHGMRVWFSMSDIINEQLDGPHGDRLVTRQQARVMIPAMKRNTFNRWVERGKIAPAVTTDNGTELFSLTAIEGLVYHSDTAHRPKAQDPVVYYLRMDNGHVKIGYTTRLVQRIRDLRRHVTDVLAIEPGGIELESERHKQFNHLRRGRWEEFEATKEILAHIHEMKNMHGDLFYAKITDNASEGQLSLGA